MTDHGAVWYNWAMEKWKQIPSNPNYFVSNHGKVKNISGLIMKPTLTKDGYERIELKQPRKKYLVHRLVAEAFVEGDRGLVVNHIDEMKTNNRCENLEFVTNRYNCEYSQGKKVYQFCLNGELIAEHDTLARAAENTSADFRLISAVCLGKRKTHYGYKWKYETHENRQRRNRTKRNTRLKS